MKATLIMILSVVSFISAQSFDYIGTRKCKMCHRSNNKGAQYKVWEKSAHANAFETLKSEEAAEIAAKKGVEGPAYEAAECLACHTTGYGSGGYEVKSDEFWNPDPSDRKAKKEVKRMASLQSVGCEACHGPGSGYKKKKTMEGTFDGTIEPASVGLWTPDETVCIACHNEKSPTSKPFNFDERVKEILHPYPEGMRQ